MSIEFNPQIDPPDDLCRQAAALLPVNPFFTPEYLEAMRRQDYRICLLSIFRGGQLICGCPALLQFGHLSRTLVINSVSLSSDEDQYSIFWDGLLEFILENKISDLHVNSFGSTEANIPLLPGQIWRKRRWEYTIDLQEGDLRKKLTPRHRTTVNLGTRTGLKIRRGKDEQACREHVRVSGVSKERRRKRGEKIQGDSHFKEYMTYVESGAGELFQAVLGDRVLSSVLVLLAPRGACGHSAGTSEEGMKCGASHFLWHETSMILKAQGLEMFNIGGVEKPDSGLARYKAGFGARRVELESAQFFMGGQIKRNIRKVVGRIRRDSNGFLRLLWSHLG